MIIEEAKKEICSHCGIERYVTNRIENCDNCGMIKEEDETFLDVVVFSGDGRSKNLDFCCWKCVFEYIPKIVNFDFFTLPYVSFEYAEGRSDKDFFEAIKNIK